MALTDFPTPDNPRSTSLGLQDSTLTRTILFSQPVLPSRTRAAAIVLTLPVYLDNHATTRVDPRVVEVMLPYFSTHYGNASSAHQFGWDAADAFELAREQVATLIGAEPREIVFTSGATEANNLAIKGVLPALRHKGNHLITAATEHRAVLDPLKRLAREGWELTVLPPDPFGGISPEAIAAEINERTVLVSIMAANNEVGTLNNVAGIAQVCRDRGVVFHTDATQAVGKIPLNVHDSPIDLLSLSAHKLYGPKGIGALYVRRSGGLPLRLSPLFDGGGHERGLRSGTLPVPLAVGLGKAAELAAEARATESERLSRLRDHLQNGVMTRLQGVSRNGRLTQTLPGNLNLSFEGVNGEALLLSLRGLAVSSGSACTSVNPEPSHVLLAMGLDEALARASLRFGLGRFTTREEVDYAIDVVCQAVERLRTSSISAPFQGGGRLEFDQPLYY